MAYGNLKLPFPLATATDYEPSGGNIPLGEEVEYNGKAYRMVKASAAITCIAGRAQPWATKASFTVGGAVGSGSLLVAGVVPSGTTTRTAAAGDRFWLQTKGKVTVPHGTAGTVFASGGALIADSVAGKFQGPLASAELAWDYPCRILGITSGKCASANSGSSVTAYLDIKY